jgi:YVTN family beta-propeller protein
MKPSTDADTFQLEVPNENIVMIKGLHGLNESPDASRLYFVSTVDGRFSYIRAMDTQTQTIVHSYSPKVGGEQLASLTPDGSRAYVHSRYSQFIWQIDTKTHELSQGADLEGSTPYMVATANGQTLYACGTLETGRGFLKAINASTQTVTKTLLTKPWPYSLAVNPKQPRLYLGNVGDAHSDSDPSAIDVIATDSWRLVARILIPGLAYAMAPSHDGTRLYVADLISSEILLIDTATHKVIKVAASEKSPRHLSVSADGKQIYVVTYTSGRIWILDAENLEVVRFIETGKTDLREVLATPADRIYVLYQH